MHRQRFFLASRCHVTPQKTSHDIGAMASRAITETKIVIIDPKQPRNASISGGLDAATNREKSSLGHFQKQTRDHESLRPLLRGTRSFPPIMLWNSSDVIYLNHLLPPPQPDPLPPSQWCVTTTTMTIIPLFCTLRDKPWLNLTC